MLYIKIQPQSFLSTGEDVLSILLYMGMAAILFNDAESFEQSVNIPSTEGPLRYLVKIGQVVLEKKNFMVLYLYIAQGQGQITPGGGGKIFFLTKTFYYFDHTL